MRICIVGSTGLTGSFLVQHALADPLVEKVVCPVRKPTNIQHSKYSEFVIDFDSISTYPQAFQSDCIISCLGTTIAKAKSTEAQKKVDYTYQLEAIQLAHSLGVNTCVLLSSFGANPEGTTFYQRIKGKLDEDVSKIGFQNLAIIRPGQIAGPRKEFRLGERIGLGIMKGFNAIGIMRSLRPIQAEDLAKAILELAKQKYSGIVSLQDIRLYL